MGQDDGKCQREVKVQLKVLLVRISYINLLFRAESALLNLLFVISERIFIAEIKNYAEMKDFFSEAGSVRREGFCCPFRECDGEPFIFTENRGLDEGERGRSKIDSE